VAVCHDTFADMVARPYNDRSGRKVRTLEKALVALWLVVRYQTRVCLHKAVRLQRRVDAVASVA
jgi:hypothetical protein